MAKTEGDGEKSLWQQTVIRDLENVGVSYKMDNQGTEHQANILDRTGTSEQGNIPNLHLNPATWNMTGVQQCSEVF